VLAWIASPSTAQTGGPFDLGWSTIDGGGATDSAGGAFTLGGSVGQPDVATVSDGPFELAGGFWPGGVGQVTSVPSPGADEGLALLRVRPASPNPFSATTSINFNMPVDGARARVRIIDLAGRVVAVLADELLAAGPHAVTWTGRNAHGRSVASGTYFLRIDAGGQSRTTKIVYFK